MYKQHFDLRKPLFERGIAQDAAVYLDEAKLRATAHVAIALTSHDSAILLCGPPGVGKTTFAAAAIRSCSPSARMVSTWLSNPPLTANELLELLLAEFGFDPYKHSRVERLQIWRQFLTELGATDTRIFIGLEQAEKIPPVVLHALASLTAADPNGCPGANLILMGQEDQVDLLNAPHLKELKQRVRLISRLDALSEEGVEAYLRHCVDLAGGVYESIFAAESVCALRAYSGGIPRVLNNLCDTALALAATAGGPSVVTGTFVTRAAVELCGMPPLTDDAMRSEPISMPEPVTLPEPIALSESDRLLEPVALPEPTLSESVTLPEPVILPDEIPVLTESVEIDLGSGEYEAVSEPDLLTARVETSIDSHAVPETDDVLPSATAALLGGVDLDDLTAELAEAILSGDLPEHLDYPDFPDITTTQNAHAPNAEEPDAPGMDALDPFGATVVNQKYAG